MRAVGVLLALATVAAGSWLGDEYWTLIGPQGRPIQGDPANFARLAHYLRTEGDENRYVAFWMTNTHYPGRMFEQFGEAFLKEDTDKYCALFTGERGESVTVCENFRILTVPERFKGREIFEWDRIWADTGMDANEADKVGYNDHRICAFAYGPQETGDGVRYESFTFGDAVPSKSTANAVNKHPGKQLGAYDNYLLKLLVGENHAQQSIPRLPAPPTAHDPHAAHRQYAERQPNVQQQHQQQQQQQQQAQEQQAQQDAEYQRRLAEYNDRLRQQQAQQQQQRDQHNHQQQQQQQVQVQAVQTQQGADLKFICDTYGRVFEIKTGEDGRARYVTYDLAAHEGVRPACTLIGETPSGGGGRAEGGGGEQRQQQQEQRPNQVRRSCSGSRQKKDADDNC